MQDEDRKRKALSQYLARVRLLNYMMGAVIVLLLLSLLLIVLFSAHLLG